MKSLLVEDIGVPDRKRIIFLGDSITNSGTYIAYMNMYFFQNMPDKKIDLINLGVNSETASGLSEPDHPFPRPCVFDRIDRALKLSKPEWVVACYGMNDGIYYPFSEQRFKAYKQGVSGVIKKINEAGAKAIILTPPPFDGAAMQNKKLLSAYAEKFSFREPFEDYDSVLRKYGQWILTDLHGVADKVIDIHTPLCRFITRERKSNPDYISGDGIHPSIQGHWIIANTLLTEMFNINPNQLPEQVVTPEDSPAFKYVLERHRVLSSAWKEYIGHTNPNKDNALPMDEAILKAAELENQIYSAFNNSRLVD